MNLDTPTMADFWAAWPLFELPSLAGAIAGGLLGLIGVYVVLRHLVFLTAAVSQAAGLGVALAFYAQIHLGLPSTLSSPTLGAALLTALTVGLAALDRGGPSHRRDSLLGYAYLLGAAGALAIGTRIVQELHDIETILFGSAVAVLPESFSALLGVSAAVLALHLWWRRGFCAVAFDPDGARVRRLPVTVIEVAFFGSLAVAVSVSTRVLGALPTFGFSVLPAMAAVRWAPNVAVALAVAAAIGAGTGFGGYVVAFLYELPVGSSQVLVGLLAVVLSELALRLRMSLRMTARRARAPGR